VFYWPKREVPVGLGGLGPNSDPWTAGGRKMEFWEGVEVGNKDPGLCRPYYTNNAGFYY